MLELSTCPAAAAVMVGDTIVEVRVEGARAAGCAPSSSTASASYPDADDRLAT